MAEPLLNNKSRDFWNEIKKIDSKGHNNPQVIDSVQNASELFADKHEKLYNCVSYNEHDMASLNQDINCCISTQCATGQCYSQHTVSPNDVELPVKKLKVNKSDVNPDIMSNHIMHGCKQLYVHMYTDTQTICAIGNIRKLQKYTQ